MPSLVCELLSPEARPTQTERCRSRFARAMTGIGGLPPVLGRERINWFDAGRCADPREQRLSTLAAGRPVAESGLGSDTDSAPSFSRCPAAGMAWGRGAARRDEAASVAGRETWQLSRPGRRI